LRFLDTSDFSIRARALETISLVGLESKAGKKVDKLSCGECQRVAIARVIARAPRLLISYEPTGNLDHDNACAILDLLASFKSENTSVIVITHAVHLLENGFTGLFVSLNSGHMKIERKV
jgi:cell division transport system ATP-binding protein